MTGPERPNGFRHLMAWGRASPACLLLTIGIQQEWNMSRSDSLHARLRTEDGSIKCDPYHLTIHLRPAISTPQG